MATTKASPLSSSDASKLRGSSRASASSKSTAKSSTDRKGSHDSGSTDATELLDEMPRMAVRFSVVTVVIAFIVVLAALAFPAVQSSIWSAKRQYELSSTKSALHASQAKSATGQPTVEVLEVYPHDAGAFTQGLLVAELGTEKFFIESTGLTGQSSLRKVDIATGEVKAKYMLDSSLFGEGVALNNDGELVMITWKSKKGFTFDLTTTSEFKVKREFDFSTFTGEGWGIDNDGTHLVVSDGSSKIQFWDPKTLKEVRQITVTYNGQEIASLNELEFANGFIYANVWYQTVIVKIDPADGKIVAVFDCAELMKQAGPGADVLNGIAYDGEEDVFYLTGKLWSRMFKVRLLA